MNYNEMNPRHRIQAKRLASALFQVMTDPTEYRLIVELYTIPEASKNDPEPIHHYYMIDGAMIDEENARTDSDFAPLPNGFFSVCGDFASDTPAPTPYRDAHPQAVAKWLLQMITRDRVRNIWAEHF